MPLIQRAHEQAHQENITSEPFAQMECHKNQVVHQEKEGILLKYKGRFRTQIGADDEESESASQ